MDDYCANHGSLHAVVVGNLFTALQPRLGDCADE